MFCPNCAAENQQQTAYCRSCGTNLQVVAVALKEQETLPAAAGQPAVDRTEQRVKLQADGVRNFFQGLLMFVGACLLGFPLYYFSFNADWHSNWILIWLIFCGWAVVVGASQMGTGLSNLVNAKLMPREKDRIAPPSMTVSRPWQGETNRITAGDSGRVVSPPGSITEATTASMDESRRESHT
jgi:hypothetical protein